MTSISSRAGITACRSGTVCFRDLRRSGIATGSTANNRREMPPLPQIHASEAKDWIGRNVWQRDASRYGLSDDRFHVVAGPSDAASAAVQQPWMLAPSESCPGAKFQYEQGKRNGDFDHGDAEGELFAHRGT